LKINFALPFNPNEIESTAADFRWALMILHCHFENELGKIIFYFIIS
jgi:hypothetical protein